MPLWQVISAMAGSQPVQNCLVAVYIKYIEYFFCLAPSPLPLQKQQLNLMSTALLFVPQHCSLCLGIACHAIPLLLFILQYCTLCHNCSLCWHSSLCHGIAFCAMALLIVLLCSSWCGIVAHGVAFVAHGSALLFVSRCCLSCCGIFLCDSIVHCEKVILCKKKKSLYTARQC